MPHEKSFMETIIPRVVRKTKHKIEDYLKQATSISIIIDIWDSKQMADFIGVCASAIFSDMSRKLFVIGLGRMLGDGHHTAENIAKSTEKIVGQYEFNYNKIKGIICDEGRALVKLLKQVINCDELDHELDDDILKYCIIDIDESSINQIKNFNNDDEIDEIFEDIKPLEKLNVTSTEEIEENNNEDDDTNENDKDEDQYNLSNGNELINELTLVVGSSKYPRFSCANHKINIATRKAIKSNKQLIKIVAKLNKFSSHTHQSVIDTQVFSINKNRLRSENITRWSSTFLLMFSFYKAYVKGIFNEDYKCPVTRSQLEFYLTMLYPLYKFTLFHQRNSANIASTIPTVQALIQKYEKMSVEPKKKQFCNSIIQNIKKKFEFELDSNVYAVATLLDVGRIKYWNGKSFANDLKVKALNSIPQIGDEFLNIRKETVTQEVQPSTSTASNQFNELTNDDSFERYFCNTDSEGENEIISKKKSLSDETKRFKNLIENCKTKITTRAFWQENKLNLPLLFELTNILQNIPSSSAYVERFFSICGVVNRKRAGNMSDETLINRSFLKTNLNILLNINNH